MLAYDWLKIIGTAAGIILVWALVFTMTATRILSSQQFGVCNYVGNIMAPDALLTNLGDGYAEGVFSHEVLEYNVEDLVLGKESAYELLQARTSTNEFDAMLVSTQWDEDTKYVEKKEDGTEETKYRYTYLESFVYSYRFSLHNLNRDAEDGFFQRMERYLDGYYGGDYLTGTLDEEQVEADFRVRVKKNKDKRYKKEAQIKQGAKDDIERVRKYRDALVQFDKYLAEGYISLTETTVVDYESGEELFKGCYSVNLCPDKTKTGKLSKFVGYQTTYIDEDGKEQTTVSAENMQICLFDANGKEDTFRYEGLLYINHLVKSAIEAE